MLKSHNYHQNNIFCIFFTLEKMLPVFFVEQVQQTDGFASEQFQTRLVVFVTDHRPHYLLFRVLVLVEN